MTTTSNQTTSNQSTMQERFSPKDFKSILTETYLRRCLEYVLAEGSPLFDLYDLSAIGICKTPYRSMNLKYQIYNDQKCLAWIKQLFFKIRNQTWQPTKPIFFERPKDLWLSATRPLCLLTLEDHVVYYVLVNYFIQLTFDAFAVSRHCLSDHLFFKSMFHPQIEKEELMKQFPENVADIELYMEKPRLLPKKIKNAIISYRRQYFKDYKEGWIHFKQVHLHKKSIINKSNHQYDLHKESLLNQVGISNFYVTPLIRTQLKTIRRSRLKKEIYHEKTIYDVIPNDYEKEDTFDSKTLYIQTDISQFFDHIRHDVLLKQLKTNLPNLEDDPYELFVSCIDQWSGNAFFSHQKIGLPQMFFPSRVLANFYLKSFDQMMGKIQNIRYFRYVDDLKIYADDRKSFPKMEDLNVKVQAPIQNELNQLGLSLNGAKTKYLDFSVEKLNPITQWIDDYAKTLKSKKDLKNVYFLKMEALANLFDLNHTEPWIDYPFKKNVAPYYISDKLLVPILQIANVLGFDHFFGHPENFPHYFLDLLSNQSSFFEKGELFEIQTTKVKQWKERLFKKNEDIIKSTLTLKDLEWLYRICLHTLAQKIYHLSKTFNATELKDHANYQFFVKLQSVQFHLVKGCVTNFVTKHEQYLDDYLSLCHQIKDYLDLFAFYEKYHYFSYLRFLCYEKLTNQVYQKKIKSLDDLYFKFFIQTIKKIEVQHPSHFSAYAFKLCDTLEKKDDALTDQSSN